MSNISARLLLWGTPAIVLFLCLALRGLDPPSIQDARHRVFDTYQRLKPRIYQDLPVVVIDVDDRSLSELGQWPWPRSLLAKLVTTLTEYGASTIVFDAVFAEPDRTSPENLLQFLPDNKKGKALRSAFAALPSHDDLFADALSRNLVVTGFALTQGPPGPRPMHKAGIAVAGKDPKALLPEFSGAVVNLPIIEQAARGNAAMNMVPERDGIVRRVPLLLKLGETLYPSLAIEGLRVAQGATTFIVKASGASSEASYDGHTGFVEVKVGEFTTPTDAAGRIWLYETKRTKRRSIPAWRVLAGQKNLSRIDGAIVLIGTSAAALADLRTTPLYPYVPGVELQAQVIEQILTQNFLNRPDWADGAEMLLLLLLGLGLIGLLAAFGPAWGGAIGFLVITAIIGASWYSFAWHGFLLDPIYPAITAVLVFLSSSVLSYLVSERQRRRLRNAFSHYVSEDLVANLIARPDSELGLGGENREISVLISDIRNFTSISERLDASTLTQLINRFLTPMADVIMAEDGTIDKFMGDAVMAFWNAPLVDPLHARKSCLSALAMQQRLQPLNAELADFQPNDGGPPFELRIGIGIASGECCVGNFGSEQRFDYSVIGDTVNLASRLEGLTKLYGVGCIVSEATHEAAAELAMIELDLVRVVGKTRPVRIFALLGNEEKAQDPDFLRLKAIQDDMLRNYRAMDWENALKKLALCRTTAPFLEQLHSVYEGRLDALSTGSIQPGWDGVYDALSK